MSARPFADPQAAAGGSHAAAYGEVHYEPVALSDRIYDPSTGAMYVPKQF